MNNSCDKTFGPRLFKNCLHKMAHMFDNNNDRNFYNWIIPFCYMDHFHVMDFVQDDLDFLLVTKTSSCPIYGSYFFCYRWKVKLILKIMYAIAFIVWFCKTFFKKLDNEELMNKLKTKVFFKKLNFQNDSKCFESFWQ